MTTFLDIVIAGLLLGGLYALIAMGLSLQYGVARVLNVSHGEFIMLGGLTTWALHTGLGLNPLIAVAICGPVAFFLGYILHRTLFRSLSTSSPSPAVFEGKSMLASFGLLFIIKNIALIAFDSRIKVYSYLNTPVDIGGSLFGTNRLVAFAFALVIGVAFYLFVARSRTGKAIRAAAQDSSTAAMMGVNINSVLAICFAFGAAMAGIAGVLLSIIYPVHTEMGIEYTVIAIIVVVLGGLGSIPGSFIGGFLIGIIGSIFAHYEPGLTLASYYIIFIILLLIKPTGIMGK